MIPDRCPGAHHDLERLPAVARRSFAQVRTPLAGRSDVTPDAPGPSRAPKHVWP